MLSLTHIPQYLEENIGAVDVKLTPEELQKVRDEAAAAGASEGDRYPSNLMHTLFADTLPL